MKATKKNAPLFFLIFGIVLVVLGLLALAVGRYQISIKNVLLTILGMNPVKSENMVVLNLRLPRMFACILIGAALASSGEAYQGIFQNPLVSPDLLGVSSGACVGAVIAIMLHLQYFHIVLFAFVFGILSVVLAVFLSAITKKKTNLVLLLSGIIVSEFMAAITGLCTFFADETSELGEIVDWRMGSIADVSMMEVAYAAPVIVTGLILMFLMRWRINLLSIGNKEAKSLGVNVMRDRYILIGISTLLTASSVAISGTIGWIGLVIPHISRWLVGSDNRYSLPLSMLLGSSFLLIVDTLARSLTIYELPLSIITGFIGAPIFALILTKKKGIQNEP